jgi:hypothetical protein
MELCRAMTKFLSDRLIVNENHRWLYDLEDIARSVGPRSQSLHHGRRNRCEHRGNLIAVNVLETNARTFEKFVRLKFVAVRTVY